MLATVRPEWLTQPPTPPITPAAAVQAAVPEAATPTLRAAEAGDEAAEEAGLPRPVVPTRAATESPTATATVGVVPSAVLERQLRVTAAAGVPATLVTYVQQLAAARPNDLQWVEPGSAEVDVTLAVDEGAPLATWVYAVAAPFATVADEVALANVESAWSGGDGLGETGLVVAEDTAAAFQRRWGEAAPTVTQTSPDRVAETVWGQRPSLALVPFDELTPQLKVMRLDGLSPLAADFTLEAYPLALTVGTVGEETAVADFRTVWDGPTINRDPAKLTRVAMTGVTALVRATASQMEIDGILAPASDVGPVLRSADIAHLSNEVAFAPDCPEPNPVGGTTFCSQVDYFELLTDLGTDVVEVTGNHVNDWGADDFAYTLDLYDEAGMQYFGGGRDRIDAAQPAIFEHNGNRIAFVGCNPVGPAYAWATSTAAGSRTCDDMALQIEQLRDEGYLVIATLQYYEFYEYQPTEPQREAFRELVDAGATAVSGSQGHHAQGFDFYNDAFIHYGLGNLFFDQMDMLGTRQTFVDTYTIYDGRLLSVDLWTGLIEDYSRPRLMTAEERAQALNALFQASGW